MKVLVLGCGPAGLMAAQGVMDALDAAGAGGELMISIISRKQKSSLYGAQYLHRPIPGHTPGDGTRIAYQLRGSSDDYRRKVYGHMWSGSVSPEDLMGEHTGWDIRATYDSLWSKWEWAIQDAEVDPVGLINVLSNDEPDVVINSIPRPAICHAGHAFGATEIWAAGDAPELGIRIPYQCPNDMVVCNAEDNPAWYRMSRVFGYTTVEWPGGIGLVPVTTAAKVRKPTKHDCDCWPTFTHVGRFGRWEKGVLSHEAYFTAFKVIDEKIGVGNAAAEAEA